MALLNSGQALVAQLVQAGPTFSTLGSKYRSRSIVVIDNQLQPYLVKYGVPNWQGALPVKLGLLRVLQRMEEHQAITTPELSVLFQLNDELFHPVLATVAKYLRDNFATLYVREPLPVEAPAATHEEKQQHKEAVKRIQAYNHQHVQSVKDTLLSLTVSRPGVSEATQQVVGELLQPHSRHTYSIITDYPDPFILVFKIRGLKTKNPAVLHLLGNDYTRTIYLKFLDMSNAGLDNQNFTWPSEVKQLKVLNLSHNNFTDCPIGYGVRVNKRLDFSYNHLTTISYQWGNVKAKRLDLSYNQLQVFPTIALYSLQKIAELTLDGNPLGLPTTEVPLTVREVADFFFAEGEVISPLEVMIFDLNLRKCQLAAIPPPLRELRTEHYIDVTIFNLDLSYNQFTELDLSVYEYLLAGSLSLSYNRLHHLSLPSQASYYSLDVSHNRLTELTVNEVQFELNVSYNPLKSLRAPILTSTKLRSEHTLLELTPVH